MSKLKARVANLKCWHGAVDPIPLAGGITNVNFVVDDGGEKFVVRIGDDIPLHQVMRFNELAASRAAYEAGLSPEVYYSEHGILVIRFITGKTLTVKDIQSDVTLERLVPVLHTCHRSIPEFIRGPVLAFWVFHVLRDYAKTIYQENGRLADHLSQLLTCAANLEKAVGQIDLVFGHNDLLASNFIDDGSKIWLIDWDYAGFNSPLFDLGGLASNNELSVTQEKWLLENYFDLPLKDELWRQYTAMKCASLLRETLWSMVSEFQSDLDFDYAAYSDSNLLSFQNAYADFTRL